MENKIVNFNEQFRRRSKMFASGICKLVDELPRKESLFYLKGQISRSGTSVAAKLLDVFSTTKKKLKSKLKN